MLFRSSAGTSFGAPNPHEVELARLVVEVVPGIEKVRMVNSGTEAVEAALKFARYLTAPEKGGEVFRAQGFQLDGGDKWAEKPELILYSGGVNRLAIEKLLRQFADAAPRLRVVNALTDDEHPCQALADMQTLRERLGSLRGRTLAYVGDGNNTATSLAHAAPMLGMSLHVASPAGYELPARVIEEALRGARDGAQVRLFRDPREAVAGAAPDDPRLAPLMAGAHRYLLDHGGDVSFWEHGWLRTELAKWESAATD